MVSVTTEIFGTAKSPTTFVTAVAWQPFAWLVSSTVKVPAWSTDGFCCVDVKPFGPVQLYVTLGVLLVAVSARVGVLQLISPPVTITFCGVVIFWLTVRVGAEIHPFGAVTVYVYTPGADTSTVGAVEITPPPGPVQTPLAPAVLIVPLSVSSVTRQVRVPAPVTSTTGESVFSVTVAVAVEVQALRPVTVRVYKPACDTIGLCWVELKLFGPVHSQVTLAVPELPSTGVWPEIQSMVSPWAVAPGATISCVTNTFAFVTQPFGAVTATR